MRSVLNKLVFDAMSSCKASNASNRYTKGAKFLLCLFFLLYVGKSLTSFEKRLDLEQELDDGVWKISRDEHGLSLEIRDDWPGVELADDDIVEPRVGEIAVKVAEQLRNGADIKATQLSPEPVEKKASKRPQVKKKLPSAKKKDKKRTNGYGSYFRDLSHSVVGLNRQLLPADPDQIIILVWWAPSYLGRKDKDFLERNFRPSCGGCRLTMDRSYLKRSSAILFDNVPMSENLIDLPPTRRTDQAYVLWQRETPTKVYHLREGMKGVYDKMFNYTLSYRRDADIIWYLGNKEFAQHSMPHRYFSDPSEFVAKNLRAKRHLAVWVVSNCNNTRGAVARKAFVDKMIDAGLEIDLYGDCFGRNLPRKEFGQFLLPYKFYLAFENSWHCRDYLTEKFWRNGLMSNVVPVVWGPAKEDVTAVAPPNSFVHAEDFESPKALVAYLLKLDADPKEYSKYFEWRKEVTGIVSDKKLALIRPGYEPAMCKLCTMISENNGKLPHKRLPSSINWLFGKEKDKKCLVYSK